MPRPHFRLLLASTLVAVTALASCGPAPAPRARVTAVSSATTSQVDPAALYCAGLGGTVIARVSAGRRADLCRLPDGRSVSTYDLINSHNDL